MKKQLAMLIQRVKHMEEDLQKLETLVNLIICKMHIKLLALTMLG
jgi:hypothetical protein